MNLPPRLPRTFQSTSDEGTKEIIQALQACVPDLLAIYGFGSRVQGVAGPHSDLDVAVLVAGYADPLSLWRWAADLSDVAGCPVDLLDLRAASTVMQYQIITTGMRWWARDAQAALFESAILSEKTALDTARAGLLADIAQRGSVYGR
ncbi:MULTISPECIES: type VII toxin-antitoxin system MntA family adenylyltransferase antitoxin [unclassified Acidovorax]|jgi:predicted nucleotidyltransferase|uniref:type VII toxin-antitoxin system MntA family adenylyltransferase antitoxin n=1 Tax=unclassified Acidovorax TaxID=2684926 RepID=UPI000B403327|nr:MULTISPECIES: nucleotidyltransferase domain-containing protein [unclassified Acidovorax]MBP3981374.1 nucleotidyltransferase domain-containing protein [Acidovorax sp. JG5]